MGDLNKNQTFLLIKWDQRFIHRVFLPHSLQCISLYYFLSKSGKISPTSYQSPLFYTPPPPSFFIHIPSFMCFIFFSSSSFSMSYLYLIRRPSVPLGSSFPNVMINRDFYGFWSYFDQLSNIKCMCVRWVVVDL